MAQHPLAVLRDYWRLIRQQRGIVLFAALMMGFFSWLIAILWAPTPIYKSVSQVQINSPQALTDSSVAAQLDTFRSVITSFPVLQLAAEHLGLFAHSTTKEDSTLLVLFLKGQIQTHQEGYTNIISIEATGRTGEEARQRANTVSEAFAYYYNGHKKEMARQHRAFVEQLYGQARMSLAIAEDSLQAYREWFGIFDIDAQASDLRNQINSAMQTVIQLTQDIQGIDAMLLEGEEKKELSERTMQGASRTRVGDTFLNLFQQLTDLLLERSLMLVQYPDDHPKVLQVQSKIDKLKQILRDELKARREVLNRDLAAARELLRKSQLLYDMLPGRSLELDRVQRVVNQYRQEVEVLEKEYQNARLREADKVEQVIVLQRAVTPTHPTNQPPRPPATRLCWPVHRPPFRHGHRRRSGNLIQSRQPGRADPGSAGKTDGGDGEGAADRPRNANGPDAQGGSSAQRH